MSVRVAKVVEGVLATGQPLRSTSHRLLVARVTLIFAACCSMAVTLAGGKNVGGHGGKNDTDIL